MEGKEKKRKNVNENRREIYIKIKEMWNIKGKIHYSKYRENINKKIIPRGTVGLEPGQNLSFRVKQC